MFFTNLEFEIAKIAEVNPDNTPRNRPHGYWKSNEKIMYSPKITTKPKTNSNFFMEVLLNNGSNNAVHKELVANPTRLTETFETRADSKKATQWMATINPMPIRFMNCFPETLKFSRIKSITIPIPSADNSPRKKTISYAGIATSFPRIPEKPQRKTMKCNLK